MPTDQDLIEHAALIWRAVSAKIRVQMFEGITDETDAKLVSLTRCLVAVTKQLGTMKRTERVPTLSEYLEKTNAETANKERDAEHR